MIPTDPGVDAPRTSRTDRTALAVATATVIVIVLGLASLYAYPILGALIGFEAY